MVKYSIGEFSKIAALTVKSLHLYHDKEILIPFEVDETTGYRYYNQRNLETAHAIATLRSFDFSLIEIKQILGEFNIVF
jgi:DNA-binding transcriptional MerR regulator